MRVSIEIIGIEDMIADMKKMQDKGKGILNAVAMSGATYALPKIKEAIPPGDDEDTTHLKDNIKTKKSAKKSDVKSSAVVEVGAKAAEYGMHLEVGHRTPKGGHVPAHPFIRNTIDADSEAIGRVMAEEFIRKVGI
jgi:HK97 gp10 family phage protein